MGASSKGCNSFIDVMDRIVRNPFKDGMMGRTYEEFLVHNHIQRSTGCTPRIILNHTSSPPISGRARQYGVRKL